MLGVLPQLRSSWSLLPQHSLFAWWCCHVYLRTDGTQRVISRLSKN
ncbi:hypothetical protein DIQ79_02410 [Mycolicibacterium smegmatis]|uniref:Uncharacterized protein n=1 Tax=Mycolicibacterium smegmatis (strain ATCC 700084 / mc(2)155) TaxID=246196 RepID=A0R5Y4_MYCS2|nr:hypothetical protein MSMEG_6357 [Mycolicibacterium smegmatis MC2 155]TBM51217.1 hypothetical protein DIQ86_05955 [Mycolicibacterium smegmatis]TBH45281.1 hypothetical protein EYS45_13095 [Mycolicibacterium smegmatis MC2 155]TBM56330.1 hypothetical protein DIQ85_02410 [Mycolicibacterium smegmatis]TBM67291.1 hypothetical protein DIQ83_02410 [Mycolicibacterium smegmatis]